MRAARSVAPLTGPLREIQSDETVPKLVEFEAMGKSETARDLT
jgi:hypothetical protein